MKVSYYSRRILWKTTGNVVIIFGVFELMALAAARSPGDAGLLIPLTAFVAAGLAVKLIRVWRLPGKNCVTMTGESISWISPRTAVERGWSAPSGTLPWSAVTGISVIAQDRTVTVKGTAHLSRGQAVRIDHQGGGHVVLPIWSGLTWTTPEIKSLVAGLRTWAPQGLIVETTALGA